MSKLVEATLVECPTCYAWIGWACNGSSYGYHAAGYHPARERAAARAAGFLDAKAQRRGKGAR